MGMTRTILPLFSKASRVITFIVDVFPTHRSSRYLNRFSLALEKGLSRGTSMESLFMNFAEESNDESKYFLGWVFEHDALTALASTTACLDAGFTHVCQIWKPQ